MTDESSETGRRSRLRRRQGIGRTGARFPTVDDDPAAPDDRAPDPGREIAPPVPDARSGADPLVGRTGARFNSRARRGRRDQPAAPLALPPGPSASSAPSPSMPPVPTGGELDPDPYVGRTGARFDSRARRARRDADRQAAEDAVVPRQAAPVGRRGDFPPPLPDDAPTAPLHLAELRNRVEGIEPRVSVRPYVRTRGRTRARTDLRVETLVSIPSPRPALEDPEHRTIGELCDGPRSVAEVAALMQVPLGVARVLIGDMADEGTLTVHPTVDTLSPGRGPDRAVMNRVLRGLHRL
ncbi:DUF742 domain-containing protein [Actinomycetospora endophytica]|uniref:DUF742 domain-containing protein n=1 Tax=Actinomycetospora endophytica TaxID=2291215 RepID=A0ABS8P9Z9_9PSEU|nr:DUF742 domain-containing protein [Actinomycetospora endophytica]MCD2194848.1 DUF742 domain-containing protein [Actinomycetospora endophytica]